MYIKTQSLSIYYQKLGQGADLIMLHGWGNDVSSFWNVAQNLKSNFTVHLIDLPGFGRSDIPTKAFTIDDYADVISEYITKQELSKPALLGHSVGGRIAIKLVTKNPNLVGKLILEDSAGIRSKRNIKKYIFLVAAKVFNFIVPNIFNLKEILRQKFYSKLEFDYINTGALRETFKNIISEDLSNLLPKVKNETLLIWGELDKTEEASLKNGRMMYRSIPRSKLEIFDGCGHFPHLENPARFIYFIKDFLS